MKTLKLTDGSSLDVAITSSGSSLVFVLDNFADCDPLVQQIKASALASLDDAPLTGKTITAITAVKSSGGVQLTFALSDTTKQQTLDDIAGGIAGCEVSSDLQQIVDYLNTLSAQAALRYYDLLVEQISSLSHMPFRCPRPRDAALAAKGYRYLLVEKYLVFYVVVGDTVQIRRILYARRNYQSVLADPMS